MRPVGRWSLPEWQRSAQGYRQPSRRRWRLCPFRLPGSRRDESKEETGAAGGRRSTDYVVVVLHMLE